MRAKIIMLLAPMFFFEFHCATRLRILSWALTTLVPFIFLATLYPNNIVTGFLTFYSVLCIYDIGYIYNDVVTFRGEDKKYATDRLKNYRANWEEKIQKIFLIRSGRVVALFVILVYLGASISVIISLGMLGISYCVYNKLRGISNLLVYPALNLLKYVPYLLTLTESVAKSLLIALVLYTAPTFLCWLGKMKFRKYYWQKAFANFDEVRLGYFIFLTSILYYVTSDSIIFVMSIYMLFLRLAFYIAIRYSQIGAILKRVRVK